MVGNPSKSIGWMSQYGDRLIFNPEGIAICNETGDKYKLVNNIVSKVYE